MKVERNFEIMEINMTWHVKHETLKKLAVYLFPGQQKYLKRVYAIFKLRSNKKVSLAHLKFSSKNPKTLENDLR
jgi:hypothetical protein